MSKHIIYLISHGHTARGAFQTGLLRKLAEEGMRVTVITGPDNRGELQQQAKNQGADVAFYSPPTNRRLEQLRLFRAYVHQDIRQNPALWEKHQRRVIDQKASRRRKLVNSMYLRVGDLLRASSWLKQLYIKWEQKQYADASATELIRELQPDAIVSTRPVDTMEAFLLNAARRLTIPRIMYVLSWDNITAKGIFPELADYYLTWGPVMNAELKQYYGARDDQLFLTGVTHFDVHYDVSNSGDAAPYLEKLGLDGRQPYLFFTMSAPYFCPDEIEILAVLVEQLNTNRFGDQMQLVIRPHVQNIHGNLADPSWMPRIMSMQGSRVAVDMPESSASELAWSMKQSDMLKLSNLLNGASVCINSGSTIAIEAALLNKPVIILAYDKQKREPWDSVSRIKEFIHLKKFLRFQAADVVESDEELIQSICRLLSNPGEKSAGRQTASFNECFKFDGRATERFATHLNQLTNHENPESSRILENA